MKYKAIFSDSKGIESTEIDTKFDDAYFYPMKINGIVVETDGFEVLTIDNPEQYSENQLARFDYDIKYPYKDKEKKLLVLKNYQLKTFIPILVLEIKSGKEITAEIQIIMNHNGGESVERRCSLLGKIFDLGMTLRGFGLDYAFEELQKQLAGHYCMETCANCKKSFGNPYGGNEFFNHLCFKSEAEAFQAIVNKDKRSVGNFMKYDNDKNFQLVQLTDYCDKFEPR